MSTTNILDLNNRIDALEKIAHNVEPIQQQIDELKAWTDPGTKDTSGNPIILTDGAELEPKVLTVTLEESEDGYSSCTVSRDSKNLLPMTLAYIKSSNTSGTWSGNDYTINGVTFTIQTDAVDNVIGIKANGTASENTRVNVGFLNVKAGQKIVGSPSNGSVSTYGITTNKSIGNDYGNGFIVSADASNCTVSVRVVSSYQASNIIFKPMLSNDTTVTYDTFEPYQHDTASISFGETINAGSVDFITGIVTVTKPEAKTLTLTPDNITLLKGYNVISSAGNIALSYHPDNLYSADLVMNNRIAALEEKMSQLAGGDTGQVLTKTSNDDFDVAWETLPATRTTTKKSEK